MEFDNINLSSGNMGGNPIAPPSAPIAPVQASPPRASSPPAGRTAMPQPGQPGVAQPAAEKSATPVRIGEKLIQLGLISQDQLEVALKEQKRSPEKKLIGNILVGMGFITESALGEVLAESAGMERFDPKKAVLDATIIRQIPKDVALRQKIVAVGQQSNSILLAMTDVYNVIAIDQVKRFFPKSTKIKPVFCNESDILELIEKYYDYETTVDGIIREIETGIQDKTKLDGQSEGYVNPTVRLVNAILIDAIRADCSDIHFEPEGTFLRLRCRIDGQMVQIRSFHKDYWPAIAVRLKIMSGMNIAETRMPQDGRITYNVAGREVDFRVAAQPTIHGENIVMRLLDKKKALLPIAYLGFSEHNEKLLKKLLKRPEGIIIVTGPTGSGKTTTLYSILEFINNIGINIMTLEDPVEYQLSLIRQSQVRENSGMSFTDGIKSIMRQDPDVIFLGEVRDQQTAQMAIRAAMTGHKVFSTLHTNDALGVIPRMLDIGVQAPTLAGALICAIAQRLSRKLCGSCKEMYTASDEDCRILDVDPSAPPTIYRAVGCDKCSNTGYKGRISVNEILPVDKGMDELISTHATRNKMMEYLMANGFIPIIQDASAKVMQGVLDIPEMIRTVDVTERL